MNPRSQFETDQDSRAEESSEIEANTIRTVLNSAKGST
jgi:hypothetical protein